MDSPAATAAKRSQKQREVMILQARGDLRVVQLVKDFIESHCTSEHDFVNEIVREQIIHQLKSISLHNLLTEKEINGLPTVFRQKV